MSSRHTAIPKPAAIQASPKPARKADLTQTLLFLSVLFVVPLLGATYWMYVQAEREIENTELQNDLVRARTVAALVERDFASAKNVLVSIAHRQAFQLSWAKRDLPAVDLHLQEVRKLEPAFLFTSAYEMDGTMRTITPDDPIVGLNFAYRDWYRGVTTRWKPYVSEVYRTAASTHPLVVAVAVPIRNEENKPDGILMSTYALDQLAHKFNELEAGSPGGELYVVDQHGFMATSPAIDPLAEPKQAPQTEAASLALAGKEGSGRFRNGSEDDFLGYAPVSGLGWAVIYRRPAREALASAVRLRQRTLSTGLYLLLIYLATATLAVILVRRQGKLVVANEKLNRELEGQIAEATRAREELDRFFTQSIDMLCIAGFDGHFKRLNPAWEKTVGYSTQDLIASPYVDFIHPDDRERTIREAEKLVAGGDTVSFENRYRCKDGSYKWLLWTSTPFPARQLIYGCARDITDRKQAEAALKQAKEEAERGSKFKDQFLSTMSHELRTPLNAVLGFSDLLADEKYGPLNDRQRRYVDHIHRGGKHLLRLISDILDLSKIEAGRMELALEVVPVDVTFGEVLSAMGPLADNKSQVLSKTAAPDLVVRADSTRFKQVLMNLLGNAIKFTPSGGRIEVNARLIEGEVRIEVRDNGPGIPPEEQKRIFEAFYRLRDSGRKSEGTGLGLAITHRLVELHGGELCLESQVGEGSCFYFSLPLAVREARASMEKSALASGGMPRVLVIEDDPVTAHLLRSQLVSSGYEVMVCDQPQNALELAAQFQPSAVTLDVVMKPKNGWEVLSQLKQDARTARIPLIVVSMIDQPGMGALLGADEYLVKPVDKTTLVAALQRHISSRAPAERKPSVLVVEDDTATSEILAEMLTSQGYAVATASDGAQARAHVASSLPELVILDLMLPKVNGFELLGEWRASSRTADLPVFILSSKDLSIEERSYLRQHAEALLSKHESWQEALVKQLNRLVSLGEPEKV
jgi:PAS domain S-box-containing protein